MHVKYITLGKKDNGNKILFIKAMVPKLSIVIIGSI